ncbi:hypothetical protein LY78DRAFT_41401 [Colletotrichum sublineola]|nr:hypothetical protein LY78DRAFT_41401 [Colletotrichum sublineola]
MRTADLWERIPPKVFLVFFFFLSLLFFALTENVESCLCVGYLTRKRHSTFPTKPDAILGRASCVGYVMGMRLLQLSNGLLPRILGYF